jgi:hypothetical protein
LFFKWNMRTNGKIKKCQTSYPLYFITPLLSNKAYSIQYIVKLKQKQHTLILKEVNKNEFLNRKYRNFAHLGVLKN